MIFRFLIVLLVLLEKPPLQNRSGGLKKHLNISDTLWK